MDAHHAAVADVRAILDLAEAEGGELHAMVRTISHTGTRRGELMGLRWEDVDLSTGRITISGQLFRTRELGLIYQPEPKTASGHRTIKVDAKTIDVLRNHRDAQDATMKRMGAAYVNKGWVFADEEGREISPDSFYKRLGRLAKRAGVAMHPHSFRHFYGSLLTNRGVFGRRFADDGPCQPGHYPTPVRSQHTGRVRPLGVTVRRHTGRELDVSPSLTPNRAIGWGSSYGMTGKMAIKYISAAITRWTTTSVSSE